MLNTLDRVLFSSASLYIILILMYAQHLFYMNGSFQEKILSKGSILHFYFIPVLIYLDRTRVGEEWIRRGQITIVYAGMFLTSLYKLFY
jgi:hypothetical protein